MAKRACSFSAPSSTHIKKRQTRARVYLFVLTRLISSSRPRASSAARLSLYSSPSSAPSMLFNCSALMARARALISLKSSSSCQGARLRASCPRKALALGSGSASKGARPERIALRMPSALSASPLSCAPRRLSQKISMAESVSCIARKYSAASISLGCARLKAAAGKLFPSLSLSERSGRAWGNSSPSLPKERTLTTPSALKMRTPPSAK